MTAIRAFSARNRFVRLSCGFLAAAVATTVAAGCGSSTGSASSSTDSSLNCHGCGDGKTIRVSLEAVGTTAQLASWEQFVAAQFKADTGANVAFTTMSTGDEVLNTIETGDVTHTGPDVLDTANSYNGDAEAAKIYGPITSADWALLGGKSQFNPGVLATSLTGGNTISWYLHTDLLAYNTKLFSEAHITSPPKTWDQYIADAKAITKLGNGIYGAPFDAEDPYDPWHETWTLTRDFGGNFINASGTAATMTSPAVEKAFSFWLSWYQNGIAPPQSIAWTGTQLQGLFAQGKLGMLNQTNQGLITSVNGTAAEGHVAFAPMPTVPPGATAMPSGAPANGAVGFDFGYTLGVPVWSSQQPLAYRFERVATSAAAEEKLYALTAALPTTVAAAKAISANTAISPFIKYAPEAIVAPSYPYWGVVENAVASASATLSRDIQNKSYSQAALQAALAKANQQIDAGIAGSGG